MVLIIILMSIIKEGDNVNSSKGRTGDKVPVSGVYKNRYGKQITLIKDDIFPACPEKGNEIEWEYVQI